MTHRTFARSVAVVAAAALTLVMSPGVSSAILIQNSTSGVESGEEPAPPTVEVPEKKPNPPASPKNPEPPAPPQHTPEPTIPQKQKPEPGDEPGESTTSLGDRIVDLAARQAGAPYIYGAEGPDQFDCSGLTQYVHARLGIDLPRTSREQRAALPVLPKSQMKPGDLLFFAEGGAVYHVGIYAGDGKMWAAPEPGDVVRLQDIWTQSFTVGRAW